MKITASIISSKWFILSLLIVASIAAYANTFPNEFVWDDEFFIVEKLNIRQWGNVPSFFTETIDGLYRPLRSMLYALIFSFSGLKPFGYHLNSLFLHTTAVILVYYIILQLTQKKYMSFISALLFAWHPMHTERVTGMTASFDLLGIVLMFGAFLLYIKQQEKDSRNYFRNYFWVYILFILALLASEEAVLFPLLVLLYHFSFNINNKFNINNNARELWKNKKSNLIILFSILILYIVIHFLVLKTGGRTEEYIGGRFYITFINTIRAFAHYPWLLIFPYPMVLDREWDFSTSFFDFKVLLSLSVLLLALYLLVYTYKKNKNIFFGLAWFWIALLPFTNFLPSYTLMAERYLYLPSFGFVFILGYMFDRLYHAAIKGISLKLWKGVLICLLIALLSAYLFLTIQRNSEWKDSFTIWSKTLKQNPKNAETHLNIGREYQEKKQYARALEEYKIAISLNPKNYYAWVNIGTIYAVQENYNESLKYLLKALEVQPGYKVIYDKLALVYARQKEYGKAINILKKAIEAKPEYYPYYNSLGTIYAKTQQWELAIGSFKKAIELNNLYDEAYYNLGLVYVSVNQTKKAGEMFERALSLDPAKQNYRQAYEKVK